MTARAPSVRAAEIVLATCNLSGDIAFFTERYGFRLDTIFPADNPAVATLSGHGVRLRLDRVATLGPGLVRLLIDEAGVAETVESPGGTRVELLPAGAACAPSVAAEFIVCLDGDDASWVTGRAGMHYRDLIPGRLGGAVIASHIRIPHGGPVPDSVHFHEVAFQLIYCHTGWVRLVYEDQGAPFVLAAGDCVIQPPGIRHRVLEASDHLQVVEVSAPGEHLTTIDHDLALPTPITNAERSFEGQRFVRSVEANAVWAHGRSPGFSARETGVCAATGGVASVQVARPDGGETVVTSHNADFLFSFVLAGRAQLETYGKGLHTLSEGDAFVIPPGLKTRLTGVSEDLRVLEVALPGAFETEIHAGALLS